MLLVTESNSNILLFRRAKRAKKISNSTYFTESNSNILLCRRAKQAKKFQVVLVLPSQLLIY